MLIGGTDKENPFSLSFFFFLDTQGSCYGFFPAVFSAAGALLSQSSTAAKLSSQTKHRTQDEKLFIPP